MLEVGAVVGCDVGVAANVEGAALSFAGSVLASVGISSQGGDTVLNDIVECLDHPATIATFVSFRP